MPEPTTWTCPVCRAEWAALRDAAPPAVCPECAAPPHPPGDPLADPLAAAGVPARFRSGFTREAWERRFRRSWPEDLDGWQGEPAMLLLWGPTGTGKTGAATLVLQERLERGGRGLWIRAQQALQLWRDAAAVRSPRKSAEASDLLDRMLRVELLVLDDLFAGAVTDWSSDRMLLVIASRYDDRRPTLITTNRPLEKLDRIEPALASRVLAAAPVYLGHEDRRIEEES